MPPSNKDGTTEEVVSLLKETLKSINGTVDFNRLTSKIGAPNNEAARKRLKRFFEKDAEPLVLTGSVLGAGEASTTKVAAKTPRSAKAAKPKTTPATPANDDDDDEDGDNDVLAVVDPKKTTKKAAPKKRKAVDPAAIALALAIKAADSSSDLSSVPDTDESISDAESPKKKAKKATPRTPKLAIPPATPKAPETPKSPVEVEAGSEEEI